MGVKPALRRRSKPRGAGVIDVVVVQSSCSDEGIEFELMEDVLEAASAASAARSEVERVSETEQWM